MHVTVYVCVCVLTMSACRHASVHMCVLNYVYMHACAMKAYHPTVLVSSMLKGNVR